MILKQTDYAIISEYPEKNIKEIVWKGNCTSKEYRDAFIFLLERQKQNHMTRFLSDVREQAVISPEDRKWFETVALPKAIELGLKAAAVVFNGNIFKKYYLNIILQTTNKFGLPLKLFNEKDPAETWLLTKD